jgi:hypothetical protein
MPDWGLVATVRAPEDQVLAFVAHHLSLGAARIWLYFDDPEDPAYPAVAAIHRVTATRCSEAHWQALGGRHDKHQSRQRQNAKHAMKQCRLPWIGHIDVDEFLHPARPVSDILDGLSAETLALRLEPFEAMHDPALADDIFTARQFRGTLNDNDAALRPLVLGMFQTVVPQGMLSHQVGKSFCRTGVKGVNLRLHAVFRRKDRINADFHPDLPLLHFHAQDQTAWLAALPFRLTRGAYQYNPDLQAHLAAGPLAAIRAFYKGTQTLTAEQADLLEAAGRLITADLGLRAKIKVLKDGAFE